jgi:hypothetical protein
MVGQFELRSQTGPRSSVSRSSTAQHTVRTPPLAQRVDLHLIQEPEAQSWWRAASTMAPVRCGGQPARLLFLQRHEKPIDRKWIHRLQEMTRDDRSR